MGEAKPALAFGETTLVGSVIDAAHTAGLAPIVVVVGNHARAVAAAVGSQARIVNNPDPSSGNMSSLLVGLHALDDHDAAVVLLADMPTVDPATIAALCDGLAASGAMCGWTVYDNGPGHPIAFTPEGIEAISHLSGTKALWPFFAALDDDQRFALAVAGDRPIDVNTQQDYQHLVASEAESTRDLRDQIIDRIAAEGPMYFDVYMDLCLYSRHTGFFSAGKVRPGVGADFVTSPEVSRHFSELVGRWAAEVAKDRSPILVEVGAGSGALLREIAPGWLAAGRDVYAIEVSASARERIAAELPGGRVVASFDELPKQVDAVVLANEVLDNLPAALVRRTAEGWDEIAVDVRDGDLTLVDVPARSIVTDWCAAVFTSVPIGAVVTAQIAARLFVEGVLRRFPRVSLCVIDYAASADDLARRDVGSVVRTYKANRTGHDWLAHPGATDITVDVNATALDVFARPFDATTTMRTQRSFLMEMGIGARIDDLSVDERRHAGAGEVMEQLVDRSQRIELEALIDPDGFGGFYVIIIESGT